MPKAKTKMSLVMEEDGCSGKKHRCKLATAGVVEPRRDRERTALQYQPFGDEILRALDRNGS